ncbi:hypothetical protein L2196_05265 [Xanthomonas perforans]|uniref:hypothetical protein n=1 Tax=Xanthomonas perforans TaxID=442694 RepID=UPI001F37D6A3|nr:hypothetical protein [Xanthomonas perforans]MCF5962164.1 hypothetical protein [Xanthomonas perforans]
MVAKATVYLNGIEYGSSDAAMGGGRRGGPVNDLADHAERKAWRAAWPRICREVRATADGTPFEITIEVNMTICADCQKWMIVEVRRHLGQLGRAFTCIAKEGMERRVVEARDTVWNAKVGQCRLWKADRSDLQMGRVRRDEVIYEKTRG